MSCLHYNFPHIFKLSFSAYSNCFETNCSGCLILTPYIRNCKAAQARALSAVNPAQFQGVRSYSAYITVKDEYQSNLFYWFFPVSELEMQNKPWIIWLQGGPGVSSMMGLFDLIGPLQIENGKGNSMCFNNIIILTLK